MALNLATLNHDVQSDILRELQDSSPHSLLNVALASKILHSLAEPLIYRAIHFTFTEKRRKINETLIGKLQGNSGLRSRVKELGIRWAPSEILQPGEGSKIEFDRLKLLLPTLSGLKTFVWDTQQPLQGRLLDALCLYQPNCKLYLRAPIRSDLFLYISALHSSPCLYSLCLATVRPPQLLGIDVFRNVIVSCNGSQLKDLAIDWHFTIASPSNLQDLSTILHLRSLELVVPPRCSREILWKSSVA